MADPQIPGVYRVLAIQHKVSGLPEDVIVNSWCFANYVNPDPDRDLLVDSLAAFYENLPSMFRPQVLVQPDMEFRIYDLADAPPREPDIHTRTVTRSASSTVFPEEVAVVLSFYADRNLPRRRGRLYLGPWAGAVIVEDGNVRVRSDLVTEIGAAAQLMHASAIEGNWVWSVLSGRDGEARAVTDGWVDNTWDTQRRRGPDPTSRTPWSLAVVPA